MSYMKKIVLIIVITSMVSCCLIGCGKKKEPEETKTAVIEAITHPEETTKEPKTETKIERKYSGEQEPESKTNKKRYSYEISEDYQTITLLFERKNTDDDKIIVEVNDESVVNVVTNEFKEYGNDRNDVDGVQYIVVKIVGQGNDTVKITNEIKLEDKIKVIEHSFLLTTNASKVITGFEMGQ